VNEASRSPSVTVIEPQSGFVRPDLGEVWAQRDILQFLVRRDVSVRYKQTLVGAAWTVLRPALLAAVFAVFLGIVFDPNTGEIPYPAFVFASMAIWLFFSEALAKCAESTINSTELISKVYFPRLIIPTSAVLPPLVDLGIALVVVVIVNVLYGVPPDAHILLLPMIVLWALSLAFGAGLWLSALAVRFRDIALVVPFLVMILLFSGAVFFPLSTLTETQQTLFSLNPLVSIMEGYRFAIFPGSDDPGLLFLVVVPLAWSLFLVVTGLYYFARAQRFFADVI
jgi:lipopolysaccharide transport system permease protein